jgi:transposase-like protein
MSRSLNNHAIPGSVIQAKPDYCPYCDGRAIVKRGLRKNSYRHLQIYSCKDCGKKFTALAGLRGVKYPPRVIVRALCLYNLGHSHQQTALRIASEHRIAVPRRTITDWISSYRSITTFQSLRAAALLQFRDAMVKERTLEHQQIYQYKVHLAKLDLLANSIPLNARDKLRRYLLSVFESFPDSLFQEDDPRDPEQETESSHHRKEAAAALRSSKSSFETLPFALVEKQNLANDLAALGLLLAGRNRDRHSSVQEFMLANDLCTVSCEVPVYLTSEEISYFKSAGFFVDLPELARPITGHIDVVQMRNGLIHLLDYKPKASSIHPVNQLVVYALALASRTRLPLKAFKCAWFDEMDYFEFFPLEAVRAKNAASSIH